MNGVNIVRKEIQKLQIKIWIQQKYNLLHFNDHSSGKQTQFDSCFCLPDFKLSFRAISFHANSFLYAFLKSAKDLSYRIG